jgi:hypothetical protein
LKRSVLIGTAVAGLFTTGITAAASAATPKTKSVYVTVTESKTKTEMKSVAVNATCKLALTTVIPGGTNAVLPGSQSGTNAGSTSCQGLGAGISRQSFSLNTSGDLTGKIQHWFGAGTVFGTYTLSPSAPSGPPTSTNFGQAAYSGTVKITGGGGGLKGTTGTAKLSCTTNDSVHYSCTEALKLTQMVKVTTVTHVPVRKKVTVRVS